MKSIKVYVETYCDDSDTPEAEREIDHADALHRRWLEKHVYWALRNQREVVIKPIAPIA